MPRKIEAFVVEILSSVSDIRKFVGTLDFDSYIKDEKTKSAVERKLLIVGEALTQLKKHYPNDLKKIRNSEKVIAFRNILVHAYFGIDDKIVWDVITKKLSEIEEDVNKLNA